MTRLISVTSTFVLLSCCASFLLVGCGDSATPSASTGEASAEKVSAEKVSAEEASAEKVSAEEVLARMFAKYRTANTYIDNAQYVEQTVLRDEGVEREIPHFQMALAYDRPGKLRLIRGDLGPASARRMFYNVACDGRRIRSASGNNPGQIHEAAAPSELTLDNFLPSPKFRSALLEVSIENIMPQLAMLMSSNSEVSVFSETSEPKLMESGKLDGVAYHRVALASTAGTRILWVNTENYSLRRMVIPSEGQQQYVDPGNRYSRFSIWIDFHKATFDEELAPEIFQMEVPSGARRVRSLVQPPPSPPPKQIGKPVGDYSFTSLDGEQITPETNAGKVTVLDVWHTRCPPCKMQTPVLETVYQQFADTDEVAFYAVSTDPAEFSNDKVAATLREWGSTMPLLRDLESSSYYALGMEATPTVVVIGPDKRVQLFQAGLHQHPEPLTKFIKQIVAGEDLAGEAIASYEQRFNQFMEDLDSVTIPDEDADEDVREDANEEQP